MFGEISGRLAERQVVGLDVDQGDDIGKTRTIYLQEHLSSGASIFRSIYLQEYLSSGASIIFRSIYHPDCLSLRPAFHPIFILPRADSQE
jgi:hypothetical protein